jgi:hypothetical protein
MIYLEVFSKEGCLEQRRDLLDCLREEEGSCGRPKLKEYLVAEWNGEVG